MDLKLVGEVELRYVALEAIDLGVGAQFYGTMEGRLHGARLAGYLRLTNLAVQRPDQVNVPTLRGLLTTNDGATLWITLDGLAQLRESDGARVFVTSVGLRTADDRYGWVNTFFGVLEGVLGQDLRARARLFECRPTLT